LSPALASSAFAISTRSASTSDLPVSSPIARKKVLAIAPPMSMQSTLGSSCSITSSLPLILAPPRIATNGPLRLGERAPEIRELLLHEQPGHRGRRMPRDALGARVRAVRRAEGVVHVQVAEPRELARERVVVLLLAGKEARVLEQEHAAVGHAPRRLLRARPPSCRRTRRCAPGAARRAARDRRSEYFASGAPFGRPRCDRGHLRAAVGERLDRGQRGADARVVAHLRRSSSGTLKSTRTSARLPRSASAQVADGLLVHGRRSVVRTRTATRPCGARRGRAPHDRGKRLRTALSARRRLRAGADAARR
jgi:hypothetical protein